MPEQSGGEASVTRIALKCGFHNPGHFAGDFRLAFGELPSEVLRKSTGRLNPDYQTARCGGSLMPDEAYPKLSNELVLSHLGSAVLLCWDELPFNAQTRILAQTNGIIGLSPVPDIRSRIVELLSRRSRI